jgi:hypothetical protein
LCTALPHHLSTPTEIGFAVLVRILDEVDPRVVLTDEVGFPNARVALESGSWKSSDVARRSQGFQDGSFSRSRDTFHGYEESQRSSQLENKY